MITDAEYRSAGGKKLFLGEDEVWNFGLVLPEQLTDDQNAAQMAIESSMAKFFIEGTTDESEDRVSLFDLWNHEKVVESIGFEFPGVRQLLGSCVGAAGANVLFSLMSAEVLQLGDPEKIVVPFWLIPYGRSRYYSGFFGRGEGSTGSGFAEAVMKDGVLPATEEGLPPFKISDGLIWSENAELAWSAGERIGDEWLSKSRRFPVKTTARMRSADDVEQAIRNLYPVTEASMYGYTARVENGMCVGRRGPRWAHQMSFHSVWRHPTIGKRFFGLMNQWPRGMFPVDPAGIPAGGLWVPEEDVEWCCRTGQVYAFSQFDGFPAQSFRWSI